jgi:uncharacterized delta-60 repeat protein
MSFSISNTSASAVITTLSTPSSTTGELTITDGSLPLVEGDLISGTNTEINDTKGSPFGSILMMLQQGDAKIDTYVNNTLYSTDTYGSGLISVQTPILQSGDSLTMAVSDPSVSCFDLKSFNTDNSGTAELMIEQPDGKAIVAGYFTEYDGDTSITRIQRFNTDLSVDTTFDAGTATNADIYAMALQPDGKIIIGGGFTTYNGVARRRIARLNTDGSLDTSFVIGTGFSASVWAVAVQEDGKILCGGDFTSYSGTQRTRIARLNTDGSLDISFSPSSFDNTIYQIKLQQDGKSIVGGAFISGGTTSLGRICRLNTNGSLDTTFGLGGGFNNDVYSLEIDSDGKIIVGGAFTQYSGQSRNRIVRLNSTDTLDNTFSIGSGFTKNVGGGYVFDINIKNGKYVVAGNFDNYNGVAVGGFTRINNDGSRDTTFNSGTGFDFDFVNTFSSPILTLSNGNTLVTSIFTEYNGTPTPNFVAVDPFGKLLNCE